MTQHSPTINRKTSPMLPPSASNEGTQTLSDEKVYKPLGVGVVQEEEVQEVHQRLSHQPEQFHRQLAKSLNEESSTESESSVSEHPVSQLSSVDSSHSIYLNLLKEPQKEQQQQPELQQEQDLKKQKQQELQERQQQKLQEQQQQLQEQQLQEQQQQLQKQQLLKQQQQLQKQQLLKQQQQQQLQKQQLLKQQEELQKQQQKELQKQQKEEYLQKQKQDQKPKQYHQHILINSPILRKEESRERLTEEQRHRRDRQCAFPQTTMHDGGYADQVHQHHNHHRRQQQQVQGNMVPNRPNSTRAAVPPPQKEGMAVNRSAVGASKSSTHHHHRQQHHHHTTNHSSSPYTTTTQSTTNGPLFYDRLVTEEMQELREIARKFDVQTIKLNQFESTHSDLERRLERQTTERMEMEATLERQQKEFEEKYEKMKKERDQEMTKNKKLVGLVIGKQKEIKRMLQRKYETIQRPSTRTTASSQQRQIHEEKPQNQPQPVGNKTTYQSPHDILEANASMQAVREANATRDLLDFFGM